MTVQHKKLCWVLTDNKAGNKAQALGLAHRLQVHVVPKEIQLKKPWKWLAPQFWPSHVLGVVAPQTLLKVPKPNIIISCGRQAVGPARFLKRKWGPSIIVINILNPHVPVSSFDLVVAPAHDKLTGKNVIPITGSLTRITPQELLDHQKHWSPQFKDLPHPIVTILVGGPNKIYKMPPSTLEDLLKRIRSTNPKGSFLITASRRSGLEGLKVIHKVFAKTPHFIWDGQGDNPYFGFLACGDILAVTADSINMISESCATGKPVYILPLATNKSSHKFIAFYKSLIERGCARFFNKTLDNYQSVKLDESARVAHIVKTYIKINKNTSS